MAGLANSNAGAAPRLLSALRFHIAGTPAGYTTGLRVEWADADGCHDETSFDLKHDEPRWVDGAELPVELTDDVRRLSEGLPVDGCIELASLLDKLLVPGVGENDTLAGSAPQPEERQTMDRDFGTMVSL